MRIAITGASGFIGSKLAITLSEMGIAVIKLSRKNGVDLNNYDNLNSIEKCDVIIHLAALNSVVESFNKPYYYFDVNYRLTLNALELARRWSAKFVFVSSYLYGEPKYLPIDEDHPISPHNPYAESKYLCEELCRTYHRQFNVKSIILRPFNVYGPGQPSNLIISEILNKIERNEKVIELMDKRPRRDYIHVEDIVRCIIQAVFYDSKALEIFNLGTGQSTSVEELVEIIQKYSSKKIQVLFRNESRMSEVMETVANTRKLFEEFRVSDFTPLEVGIKGMLKAKCLLK